MTDRRLDVWWGPGPDESASALTARDVYEVLDRLQAQAAVIGAPILVDVIDDAGATLTIGVGRAETVLCFMAAGDPPYFTTHATVPLVTESLWFDYGGSESEVAPSQVIAYDEGRRVVRAFAESGDRSGVEWQEA